MRNEKITPLYERLSRDDELQGESNSISVSYTHLDVYKRQPSMSSMNSPSRICLSRIRLHQIRKSPQN